MKIWVRGDIIDAECETIVIALSQADKRNLKTFLDGGRFVCYGAAPAEQDPAQLEVAVDELDAECPEYRVKDNWVMR